MSLANFGFGMFFYRVKAAPPTAAGTLNESPWSNTRAYNFGISPYSYSPASGLSARSVSYGSSAPAAPISSTSLNSGGLSAFAGAMTVGGISASTAPTAQIAAVKAPTQSSEGSTPLIQSLTAAGISSDSNSQKAISNVSSPYTAGMIAPLARIAPAASQLNTAVASPITRSSYTAPSISPVRNAVSAYYRNSGLSQSPSLSPVRITALDLTRSAPVAASSLLLPRSAPSAMSAFQNSLYELLPLMDKKE